MFHYAGIGSRKTPEDILALMKRLGHVLATKGGILRSGGADGADSAFEYGCDEARGEKGIYLPWRYFNKNRSQLFDVSNDALSLAAIFHPYWDSCSQGARKLHGRNCYQVLGKDLKSPSLFILCWSDGTGGTEQALRIAKNRKITIINIYDTKTYEEIMELCNKLIEEKSK